MNGPVGQRLPQLDAHRVAGIGDQSRLDFLAGLHQLALLGEDRRQPEVGERPVPSLQGLVIEVAGAAAVTARCRGVAAGETVALGKGHLVHLDPVEP